MPYVVTFTEKDRKVPITVYDNTSNTDTSLNLPGRNQTGYGQIIAENFIRLLENFAGPGRPVNPVEGQLWYDTTTEQLKIWDSIDWKAASNIQTSVSEPQVGASRKGDLWVDTNNQQLSIYSGSKWILVGPYLSTIDGKRTGPIVETIIDQNNQDRVVVTFFVDDSPIVIISKDQFYPKSNIEGFVDQGIRPGINITTSSFVTGFPTRLLGVATSAESLRISGADVAASRFLRSDIVNTTDFQFNVRNNLGITIGADSTLNIANSTTGARIYNSLLGASIDLQTSKLGFPSTVLRVINDRVGVNTLAPTESLDVTGNAKVSGSMLLTSDLEAVNLNSGALQVTGGAAIKKKLVVGGVLEAQGNTVTKNILPAATDIYNLGSSTQNRYNEVYARKIIANEFDGSFVGNISGNADTANSLRNPTTFRFTGAVTLRNDVVFDGSVNAPFKEFQTELSVDIIQDQPSIVRSTFDTTVLVYIPRSTSATRLGKMTRDDFVGPLAVPVGTILPFAGTIVPNGYLLCDGAEILRNRYADLYEVLTDKFVPPNYQWRAGSELQLYFKLPDFRGRFPLGVDNMSNGATIAATSASAGGGQARRVLGSAAETVGGASGEAQYTLNVGNLPQHQHNLRGTRPDGSPGEQYYAVNATTATPIDAGSSSRAGGIPVGGQLASLPSSGNISDQSAATLSQPFSIMNPFQTVNYIIRFGRDFFDASFRP
jgi:microcystin-dependent protein